MDKRDIIAIGTSAGGVEALLGFVKTLPADFPGTIFIVQHVPPYHKSNLPGVLSSGGLLKAVHPQDGDPVEKGMIYVAPVDHHLLVENDRVLVKKGPKENKFRPSIDALFRSAAYSYGSRVIGVVLSGLLDDGTPGLWSIKRLGGVAIVQNPSDAMYANMANNAIAHVEVDHVVPVEEMGRLIGSLMQEVPEVSHRQKFQEEERIRNEVKIAANENALEVGSLQLGKSSPFNCPECNGSLVIIRESTLIRYRCHTGHAFTSNALLSEASGSIEANLWKGVRGMEEVVLLLEDRGKEYENSGQKDVAARFYQKAQEIRDQSNMIRETIFLQEHLTEEMFLEPKPEAAPPMVGT